jgi:DNA adenine methylase
MSDALSILEGLDALDRSSKQIIRAPFPYVGGKSRTVNKIIARLPPHTTYVEPFCGTAVVLLNKPVSKLEVINDMDSGIVCFYRCLRNDALRDRLIDLIRNSVHAREEWVFCKETWESTPDDVERAFKWYYVVNYSFGGLSRNFGRALVPRGIFAGKIQSKIPEFHPIAQRLKNVQVEHMDALQCIREYDGMDVLFYVDPPYIEGDQSCYKARFDKSRHVELLDTLFASKAKLAVSGYHNPLYDKYPWTDSYSFTVYQSIQSEGTGTKVQYAGVEARGHGKEMLWVRA